MQRLIPGLILWALCAGAGAQTLYKCTVNGTLTYSGSPCPGARSEAVAVPEAPKSDTDNAAELKRQQAASAELEKKRLAREQLEERNALQEGRAAQARRMRCDRLALEAKWAEEEAITAAGNKNNLMERARRKRESLAVQCPV